jgi:hypothetical protein
MVGILSRVRPAPTKQEVWNNFWTKATAKASNAWEDMMGGLMAPGNALRGQYDQVQVMPDGSVSQIDPRMIDDASSLAGMVTLGSGAIPRPAGTLDMGFKAYHGSPHDFDKFSMDKIGTGEGAQVYGRGLYFAENPAIANDYREALAPGHITTVDGVDIDTLPVAEKQIARWLSHNKLSPEAARKIIERDYKENLEMGEALGIPMADSAKREFEQSLAALDKLQKAAFDKRQAGRMYEVDIDAEDADFLDWDKPLSEQPKKAREALEAMLKGRGNWRSVVGNKEDPTIGEMQAAINFNSPAEIERLQAAGVPGIRYLDQGSRGKGEGTRNFVVFDDKLISILSKK